MKLAELFVQLTVSGWNALKGTLGAVNVALKTTEGLAKGLRPFVELSEKAFNRLTLSIMGFVTAGLLGTAEGNALAFQMRLLAMEIAGIFLPTFDRVLHTVRSMVAWFKQLTGEQQETIARFVEMTVVGLGVFMVLGKITVALGALSKGLNILIGLGAGHPIILGLTLAALAASAAFAMWKTHTEGVAGTFSWAIEGVQKLWGWITNLAGGIADYFGPAVTKTFGYFSWALTNVMPLLESVGTLISEIISLLADIFAPLVSTIGTIFDVTFQAMAVVVRTVVDSLKLLVDSLIDLLKWTRDAMEWLGLLEVRQQEAQEEESDRGKDFSGAGGDFGPGSSTHRSPTFAGGGFQGVADTFKQIQSTISKIDYQEKIADNTKRAADGIEQLVNGGFAGAGGDFGVVGP